MKQKVSEKLVETWAGPGTDYRVSGHTQFTNTSRNIFRFAHTHRYTAPSNHRLIEIRRQMTAAMLRSVLRRSTRSAAPSYYRRFSSEAAPERKVAILGAAGGIGQPLSLLMKLNPLVSSLALYDIGGTHGVAVDVSHVNTRSEVSIFSFFDYQLLMVDFRFWSISAAEFVGFQSELLNFTCV